MKLGEINTLRIARETGIGLFLVDETGNEVLLPKRFAPEVFEIDQDLDVFVYNDSEGRLVCTTQEPDITLNSFALLRCRDATDIGAFMEIGIMKDLILQLEQEEKAR